METPLKVDTTQLENNEPVNTEPRTTLLTKEELMQQDLENDGFVNNDDGDINKKPVDMLGLLSS